MIGARVSLTMLSCMLKDMEMKKPLSYANDVESCPDRLDDLTSTVCPQKLSVEISDEKADGQTSSTYLENNETAKAKRQCTHHGNVDSSKNIFTGKTHVLASPQALSLFLQLYQLVPQSLRFHNPDTQSYAFTVKCQAHQDADGSECTYVGLVHAGPNDCCFIEGILPHAPYVSTAFLANSLAEVSSHQQFDSSNSQSEDPHSALVIERLLKLRQENQQQCMQSSGVHEGEKAQALIKNERSDGLAGELLASLSSSILYSAEKFSNVDSSVAKSNRESEPCPIDDCSYQDCLQLVPSESTSASSVSNTPKCLSPSLLALYGLYKLPHTPTSIQNNVIGSAPYVDEFDTSKFTASRKATTEDDLLQNVTLHLKQALENFSTPKTPVSPQEKPRHIRSFSENKRKVICEGVRHTIPKDSLSVTCYDGVHTDSGTSRSSDIPSNNDTDTEKCGKGNKRRGWSKIENEIEHPRVEDVHVMTDKNKLSVPKKGKFEKVSSEKLKTCNSKTEISVSEVNLLPNCRKNEAEGMSGRNGSDCFRPGVSYYGGRQAWVAEIKYGGKRHFKVFSVAKYGYDGAQRMAAETRRRWEEAREAGQLEIIIQNSQRHHCPIQSGVKGVYYDTARKGWRVVVTLNCKQMSRFFLASKFGNAEAKRLAVGCRHQWLEAIKSGRAKDVFEKARNLVSIRSNARRQHRGQIESASELRTNIAMKPKSSVESTSELQKETEDNTRGFPRCSRDDNSIFLKESLSRGSSVVSREISVSTYSSNGISVCAGDNISRRSSQDENEQFSCALADENSARTSNGECFKEQKDSFTGSSHGENVFIAKSEVGRRRKRALQQNKGIPGNNGATTDFCDVRGVYLDTRNNAWAATMGIKGRNLKKSFAVAKHGYETALQLAIRARKQLEQLYWRSDVREDSAPDQGINVVISHGKKDESRNINESLFDNLKEDDRFLKLGDQQENAEIVQCEMSESVERKQESADMSRTLVSFLLRSISDAKKNGDVHNNRKDLENEQLRDHSSSNLEMLQQFVAQHSFPNGENEKSRLKESNVYVNSSVRQIS